jgi:hypothetical protein
MISLEKLKYKQDLPAEGDKKEEGVSLQKLN